MSVSRHRLAHAGAAGAMLFALGLAGTVALPAGAEQPGLSPEDAATLARAQPVPMPASLRTACDTPRLSGEAIGEGPLKVSSIGIEGAVRITALDLSGETAPLIGRSVDQATLDRLAARVGCVYRREGYLYSRAVVEPVVDGVWRLRVIEGRVDEVVVHTGHADLDAFLRRAFGKVRPGQPLSARDLAEGLNLANRQGVWSVSLKAAPGASDPDALTLIIDAPKPAPVVFTSVQNNAPESVGQWWAGATAMANGVTPLYEQTSIGVFHSLTDDRQRGVQISSRALLNENGLGGRVDLAWFEQRPDEKPPIADTIGTVALARVELDKPLHAEPGLVVTGRAGLEAVGQRTRIVGGPPTVRDDLRVAYAGVRADRTDGDSSQSFDLVVRQGLDIAGASRPGDPLLSRPDANPQATVVRAEASARRPLAGGTVQARVRGQWADEPLLAYEEFTFGGAPGGRGLDSGAMYGDRGVAVGLDWYGPERRFDGFSLSPIAFVEAAQAWNEDNYGPRRSRIALGGGGVRIRFGKAAVDIVYARPIDEPKGVDKDRFGPRVLVTLTSSFGG